MLLTKISVHTVLGQERCSKTATFKKGGEGGKFHTQNKTKVIRNVLNKF